MLWITQPPIHLRKIWKYRFCRSELELPPAGNKHAICHGRRRHEMCWGGNGKRKCVTYFHGIFNWPEISWRVFFHVVWRVKFHVKDSVRVRELVCLKLSNRVAVKFCLPQVYNNTTIILSLFIQSEGLESTRDRTRAAEGRMARSRVWEVATKMASGEGQGLDFCLWWGILDNTDILRNDMALELKLHSPAGAESIVYTWPLQKSVSFIAGAEILSTRLRVRSVLSLMFA